MARNKMKLPNGYGSIRKQTGKRRKPYQVLKTFGWKYDPVKDKMVQDQQVIGYARTREEGLQMLAEYNHNPYDIQASRMTFEELYSKWSEEKFSTLSRSSVLGYEASYKECAVLYDKIFKSLKTSDFQSVIDHSDKNYPTLRKIKLLFTSMTDYALKNDIAVKDYAHFVDIDKHRDKNPDKIDREPFTTEEVNELWRHTEDPIVQVVLILIYSGVRIGELLELKKESINFNDHTFKVNHSKTDSGIRTVPIADKTYPFFKNWFSSNSEYLIHMEDGSPIKDWNFRNTYWTPCLAKYGMENHKPHDTRHTCASMLHKANINQTTQKKILGHKGKMSLTENVYTHLEIQELLDAINKI